MTRIRTAFARLDAIEIDGPRWVAFFVTVPRTGSPLAWAAWVARIAAVAIPMAVVIELCWGW